MLSGYRKLGIKPVYTRVALHCKCLLFLHGVYRNGRALPVRKKHWAIQPMVCRRNSVRRPIKVCYRSCGDW